MQKAEAMRTAWGCSLLAVDVHELQLEVAVPLLAGRLEQEVDGVARVLRLIRMHAHIVNAMQQQHMLESMPMKWA